MIFDFLKREQLYPPVKGREGLKARGIFQSDTDIYNKEMSEKNSRGEDITKIQNYWYIHGKVYDLSSFMDTHPGGRVWLELTRGQDITESYETHHINQEKPNQILKKCYVKQQENFEQRFTFHENGLYKIIQKRVLKELGDKTGYTNKSVLLALSIFGLWFLLFSFMCYTRSLIVAFFCGWALFGMMGIGHNFFHQKLNNFRFFWDFSCFHHHYWISTHILSHHVLINTEQDFEIFSMEPFLKSLSSQSANTRIVVYPIYFLFTFLLSFGSFVRQNLVTIFQHRFRIEFIIPYIQFIIICVFGEEQSYPTRLLNSLILWSMMHSTSGFFLTNATFMSHRTEYTWTEGDKPVHDFGEHTVITSHDHDIDLPLLFSYLIFGGFNEHIVHHLFPTMDKVHFPKTRQIIQKTLKEFDITYTTINSLKAYISVLKNYTRERPPCIEQNQKKQN